MGPGELLFWGRIHVSKRWREWISCFGVLFGRSRMSKVRLLGQLVIVIRFKNTNLRIVCDHLFFVESTQAWLIHLFITNKDIDKSCLCCYVVTILSTVLWLIVKFMSKALLHCLEAIVLYLQCVVPRRRKQEEGTVVPKGNEIACCGFDFRSNFLATWKLKIREYSTGARTE